MKRKEALEIVKLKEGKFPKSYMGKKTEDILSKIGINMEQFTEICDKFTNKKIFVCGEDKKLLKKNNNLIKIKYDN